MASTVSLPPTIRADDEGERRWFFGGGVHTWKVTPEETGGAFMLFEARNGTRQSHAAAHARRLRRDDVCAGG